MSRVLPSDDPTPAWVRCEGVSPLSTAPELPTRSGSECNGVMTPSDVSDLVDRRAALLRVADRSDDERRELERSTSELRELLERREPHVRRITSDEPGDLLERLAAAEPVHPISDADDLADRLDDDRRCFVLEHPLLPGRPLNVVWVALWRGVPDDLSAILDPGAATDDPAAADTAVFYSIWNVEPGLVGLPGGRALLGGVVEQLRSELPGLSTFITLSPVPGFRRWDEAGGPAGIEERTRACARYLTSLDDDGRPIDPVARFHLGNGARLFALAPGADGSPRGLDRSYGIMANYRYEPEDRSANAASLRAGHPVVGPGVAALLD